MNYNFKYLPPKNFINHIDFLNIINENLSMREVCEFYDITINQVSKALCPFHNDTHNSLHIYEKRYYCFSCNAHGNIIDFVKNYFNLSFQNAIKKINTDFNLNLPIENNNLKENQQLNAQLEEKRKQLEERKQKYIELAQEYDRTLNFWIKLDKIIIENKNSNKSNLDQLSDEYIIAVKNIDYAYYCFECADFALKEFLRNK